MSKIPKIFVECEEANHFCDKNQYKEASLWEKLRLGIHLIYCKACKEYSVRNGKLSRLMKKSNVKTFAVKDKSELERLLRQEMSK